jgi:spore coat polysaccharide biosynthesis protein SpsF (cytidylyltransferase family)
VSAATTVSPAALVAALVYGLAARAERLSGRAVVYVTSTGDADVSRAIGALDTLTATLDILPGDADDVLDRFIDATNELLHAIGVGR